MKYGDWRGIEGRVNSQDRLTPNDTRPSRHDDAMSIVWGVVALVLMAAGAMSGQIIVTLIGLGLLIKACS